MTLKTRLSVPLGVLGLLAVALASGADRAAGTSLHPYAFVFDQKCAACHGGDGRGRPSVVHKLGVAPDALDLTRAAVRAKTTDDLESSIRYGKGKMPAFNAKFEQPVIEGLARYVKALTEGAQEVHGPTPSPAGNPSRSDAR